MKSNFKFLAVILLVSSFSARGQSLTEYQQEAVENNPGVLAKYKLFEANLTRVGQVNSLQDPTLSFGYFISPIETRVGPQRARLSLTQMFPWFGTLKAKGDVAALQAEASYQSFVDQQNQVRSQVAKAYFPMVELEQVEELQQENLAVLESWKRLAIIKYESGKTSLADVLRIDVQKQEIETELSLLNDEKRPYRVSFNRLLNRSDTSTVNLSDTSYLESAIIDAPNWDTSPQIVGMSKQVEANQKQLTVIEKQGLPKIGAGVDYMLVGERTDMNVIDNGKNAFMPMVSISLPIFRRKYQAAGKETELRIESLQYSISNTANQLSTQYERLRFEINRELQLLELYAGQIEETLQIQNLLFTAFSDSGNDLDELLRIQMQLLSYQIKQEKSKTRLKTAMANLEYLSAESN